MANRGVLFALTDDEAEQLYKLRGEDRVDFVLNEIEDNYFENNPGFTCETDKAWDAIHRSLTDGYLHWENGEYPLSHVILGGEVLYGHEAEQDDFIIVYKDVEQVQAIAKALHNFSDEAFKKGYAQIDLEDYEYQLGFEDLEYSLSLFHPLQDFWQRAAAADRSIIFTCAL